MVEKGLWADRRDTVWMAAPTAEYIWQSYTQQSSSRRQTNK